jgi:integrase/recombinase XerD
MDRRIVRGETGIGDIKKDLVPALIAGGGKKAVYRFAEFFTANIRNANTRTAYGQAVAQFCAWSEQEGYSLAKLNPVVISAYVEKLGRRLAAPTVKQHLAAIRMLFDWFVVGQVVPFNPAASVKGPKHVVKRGKTPVLTAKEARQLLDSIDVKTIAGLRDRALIGVMLYTFSRVSAAVSMNVGDYHSIGRRCWIRLREKGGKHHEVPAHHNAASFLDDYIEAAQLCDDLKAPLFRTLRGRSMNLTTSRMSRGDALRMIKRRTGAIGLPVTICCHTFRGTGITTYLENGGTIEKAQAIAAHESPETTKLYDRTKDELTLDEIERIAI